MRLSFGKKITEEDLNLSPPTRKESRLTRQIISNTEENKREIEQLLGAHLIVCKTDQSTLLENSTEQNASDSGQPMLL